MNGPFRRRPRHSNSPKRRQAQQTALLEHQFPFVSSIERIAALTANLPRSVSARR
jgi:hypothetical protein